MAGDNQHFCLRWNNHQSTLISVFDTLLESGTLVDCTLAAEGQFLKAHKVVLCACSPYLEVLLSQHYEKHPIVILKDIKFQELKSMMDYMYRGEVNISQDQLSTFLKAAESLQIKGLTDGGGNEDGAASSSAPAKAPIATPVRKPVQQAVPRPTAAAAQGLTIERRPESPHIRSRDDSASPTPRKRRRNQRRPSTSDDPDSHIDTSNSCDVPPLQSGALSGVGVPNIPATITKGAPLDDGDHETENSRVNNHDASADGVAGPKIEPTGELIEPKTEYLEEMNNEDSIEDLTLDDDDDMDNSMDMSRAGPSHDNSNQSFGQWPMSANQTDEVFMNAQEAVGAHRDTQDDGENLNRDADPCSTEGTTDGASEVVNPIAFENHGEAVCSIELENNEEAVNPIYSENNEQIAIPAELENKEETETLVVRRDSTLRVKPDNALLTNLVKEEIPDIEYQTVFNVKDEIEDEVEEAEVKVEEPEIVIEPVEPLSFIEIPLPKVAIPKLHRTVANKFVKNQTRKPRTILPMTQPMAHISTSHLEQASTPHQIIMPSSQMPGIAYQIFLGDNSKNSNNPVQYTMLQPQPVFLQPTPTSVSSASSVVMSQSSMVINPSFQMTQAQNQSSTNVPQIAPLRRVTRSRKKSCSFCYKLFNDINEHLKECWLNPDSKRYKFRKIAPSTS